MAYAQPSGTTQIQCKQQEMADTLGVSRVSMSSALSRLVDLNLIELGYAEIRLVSLEGLEEWISEHCSTTPLNWG